VADRRIPCQLFDCVKGFLMLVMPFERDALFLEFREDRRPVRQTRDELTDVVHEAVEFLNLLNGAGWI
jgi:hypothetical protein